ncbi:MAG: diaminobutyrate acetyltransferase [Burkholderiales bacterium]|nr:MAG: diaminobutyrate acetyltransferase [Burkholderiales bacterium]
MTLPDRNDLSHSPSIQFRPARPGDGAALWRLVQATGTLELNSAYFYLLWATEFGETCLVAEEGSRAVGLVIGFHPPRHPDAAFVWQVGVLPSHRGQGLGLRMLRAWKNLPANAGRQWVTATVAEDNTASLALFHSLARASGTRCESQPHFTADQFPVDHPAEPLLRVGPFPRAKAEPT